MATIELLKLNLPIEPDLQNFIGLALTAVKQLGGNAFAASRAALGIVQQLRASGAASGYPLPARLLLDKQTLTVAWGDSNQAVISALRKQPDIKEVSTLFQKLQHSTEMSDPTLLLRRNLEMARYLDETRQRTEQQLHDMQQALEQRQAELWNSVRQAETDPLTGLLNRRAFDDRIEKAFRRTLRQKNEALSLVFLDLDFFKQINDEFGHPFGDAYLNKMAHAMRDVIRTDVDLAFRTGGDEFAMLIFADVSTACSRSMKILSAMDHKVSIGITSVASRADDIDLETFIRRADEALYAAKRAGRGRVIADQCVPVNGNGCNIHCLAANDQ